MNELETFFKLADYSLAIILSLIFIKYLRNDIHHELKRIRNSLIEIRIYLEYLVKRIDNSSYFNKSIQSKESS